MKARHGFFVLLTAFLFSLFFLSCRERSKKTEPPDAEAALSPSKAAPAEKIPAWQALAVLKTGEHPLWFEFSAGGPRRIQSPAEASVSVYEPWPFSRFSSGMLIADGNLVMAVNRDGFLVFEPETESNGIKLYRAASPGWDPYTIASVFLYQGKPAALLYRDDFFREPLAPGLEHQVQILEEVSAAPKAAPVPALEFLPKDERWEANALRLGADGNWYFRFVQTGKAEPGTLYYKTGDLSVMGEKTGMANYRAASLPEKNTAAPSSAAALLGAGEIFPGLNGISVTSIVSPDFPGPRFFSPRPGALLGEAAEEPAVFFGYCRDTNPAAFILTPEGKGAAFSGGSIFEFSLPALPGGFSYTAAALAGNVLIASWEEQEESAVGAAGFMALHAEKLGF